MNWKKKDVMNQIEDVFLIQNMFQKDARGKEEKRQHKNDTQINICFYIIVFDSYAEISMFVAFLILCTHSELNRFKSSIFIF